MEALARYYVLGRPVDMHNWNSDGRLEFIGDLTEQYKVDGIVSEIVRFCTYNGWDKFDLEEADGKAWHPDPGDRPGVRRPGWSAGEDPRRGASWRCWKAGPSRHEWRVERRTKSQSKRQTWLSLGSTWDRSTKVVILEGDVILGWRLAADRESAETEARMAVQEALRQTGLTREDLKAAVVTGTLACPSPRR